MSEITDLATQIAVKLCVRFEGVYLESYLCPAGVATIGVGSTRYLDGTAVCLTDVPITSQQAMELLKASISATYLPAVLELCPGIDSASRLAALIDFTYNLGAGNLKNSTLRKRVNARRWNDVPAELRKWTRGGGRELKGLVLRREAEAMLI